MHNVDKPMIPIDAFWREVQSLITTQARIQEKRQQEPKPSKK
jgi:hypothetical protein